MIYSKLADLVGKKPGKTFSCTQESIVPAVDYVHEILTEKNIDHTLITKAILKLEDTIDGIILKSPGPKAEFSVLVTSLTKKRIVISVRCPGAPISLEDVVHVTEYDSCGPEIASIMKEHILPLYSKGIRLRHRYGVNTALIQVDDRKVGRLELNLLLMCAAIVFGIIIRSILPATAVDFLAGGIFGTVITIFFNLLKMIVAPLVFVSILSSIVGFGDLKELGRISGRSIGLFAGYSVIALLVGVLIFRINPAGDPSLVSMIKAGETTASSASASAADSLKNLLIGIFPNNLLGPFVNNDVLAVIFIAVLTGICISRMQPDHHEKMLDTIDTASDLIYKLTETITFFMPVMIFCSMAKITLTIRPDQMRFFAIFLIDVFIGCLIMLILFLISLKICGSGPIEFIKGYAPALVTAFTTASSSATVPVSLKCCKENLKIPDAINYFVIPLGSTINMNGSCIVLTINVLFLARAYGINLTPSMLIPLLLMILLLSMAAPGIPGSLTIMLATVLSLLNIPAEAANLTMGFASIVGMLIVPVNSMGDAMVAMLNMKAEEKRKCKKNHNNSTSV